MKSFKRIEELLLEPETAERNMQTENFRICVNDGGFHCFGPRSALVSNVGEITFDREENGQNYVTRYYKSGEKPFEIAVRYEFFENSGAVRETVSARNLSDREQILTHLSSACFVGLGLDGFLPWYDKNRFILHTCDTVWMAETQWRQTSLHEIGVVPTSTYFNAKDYRIASIGSWTTTRYYPAVVLEDTETGKSFYLELEPAGSWEIVIGNVTAGFAQDGMIGIEANCANIDHDGWNVKLAPGESFTAQPCVYGIADGGFEEAAAELTAYKRETNLARFPGGSIPVTYNCFMDGIGGNPTSESLIPLIDACAEAGVEIFCIDAGWYCCYDDPAKNAIGDYNIADDRFPGYGLKGIFDYMYSKNIKPGIWLEAECCQYPGTAYNISENCLCRRFGTPLEANRAFFNFREKCVRDHIMRIIDRLYGMGLRYIKNDYNQPTGYGFSNYGEACSKESSDNVLAVLEFFDAVRAKYPDIILENCGSGGQREDNNTLKYFHLQSTSDQELYWRYPSVLSGSLAVIPPEKAGAWALPYPCYTNGENRRPFHDAELWKSKRRQFADGEETVFNIVTGLIADLYLGGRIDKCDAYNAALIREGVEFFKKNRGFTVSDFPVWPAGMFHIDDEGIFCTGLVNKAKKRMLLAVWNINAHKKTAVFDLSKWAGKTGAAKIAYPAADTRADCVFNSTNRKLSVSLPDIKYSARLIEIRL